MRADKFIVWLARWYGKLTGRVARDPVELLSRYKAGLIDIGTVDAWLRAEGYSPDEVVTICALCKILRVLEEEYHA